MKRTLSLRLLPCTALCALSALLCAAPTAAQAADDQAGLTARKMWTLARLGETAISPDGSLAAVTVTHFDIEENRSATDIWLVPTKGGKARPLTGRRSPTGTATSTTANLIFSRWP